MGLSALGMLGYDNVKSFPPGWKGWSAAEEEVSTEAVEAATFETPEVDPEMLAAVAEFLNNIPEGWLAVKDVDQLSDAIDNGAFVIDVREADEYDQGHITGAVNIPMRTIAQNVDEIPTDQPVVVYCASGHRAAMSLAALQTMGLNGSRSFPGGYGAWESAGAEVEIGSVAPEQLSLLPPFITERGGFGRPSLCVYQPLYTSPSTFYAPPPARSTR